MAPNPVLPRRLALDRNRNTFAERALKPGEHLYSVIEEHESVEWGTWERRLYVWLLDWQLQAIIFHSLLFKATQSYHAMLFVVCFLVALIAPAICDRPSLSFDQSVELGPHVAIDLKKHNLAASLDANHTVSSSASLQAPEEDEKVLTFTPPKPPKTPKPLGFDVAVSKEGKYIVRTVHFYGKVFDDLDPGMEILRINQRPVEEMTRDDVLKACKENKPFINELLIRKPGSALSPVGSSQESGWALVGTLQQLRWMPQTIAQFKGAPCMAGEVLQLHAQLSAKQYECALREYSGRVPDGEEKATIISIFKSAEEANEAAKPKNAGLGSESVSKDMSGEITGSVKPEENIGTKSSNPRADSHFVRNGDFASEHLQHELCLALHRHQHEGLPIYTESVSFAHARKSEKPWRLFLVCPRGKTSAEVERMHPHIRDAYMSHKETSYIVVQAVQKRSHRAIWLADKASMVFNKERHTLSADIGIPLNPRMAYARVGENISSHESPEVPEVLKNADCLLTLQFYFIPVWDENALAKGEWVVGAPRADIIPTIQCCTASSSPCTESNRRWWKTFV